MRLYEILFFIWILENGTWLLDSTRIFQYILNNLIPSLIFSGVGSRNRVRESRSSQRKTTEVQRRTKKDAAGSRSTRYIKRGYDRISRVNTPLERTRQYKRNDAGSQRRIYVSVRWNVRDKWKIARSCALSRTQEVLIHKFVPGAHYLSGI